MGLFSSIFGGGKKDSGSSNQQESMSRSYDPLQAEKNAVASPLSAFLAANVGKGIGEYPTDPNYTNRYNEYLSMNPSQYFQEKIASPATKRYKEDFLPLVQEGYAGSLRGSGRFGAEEAGINRFSEDLSMMEAEFVPSFAKSQIEVGQTEFKRQYDNWFNGLAVNNPILGQAINFLNSGRNNVESSSYIAGESGGGIYDQLGVMGSQLLGKYFGEQGSMGGDVSSTGSSSSGGGFGGAASGAASGAMMGSNFGPWGTAIGGVVGGILGYFKK